MNKKKLFGAVLLATLATSALPTQAWWSPWNGPSGYNGFGPFDGFMSRNFSFNSSFNGNGYGRGYGYAPYQAAYPYYASAPAPTKATPTIAIAEPIIPTEKVIPEPKQASIDNDSDNDNVADSFDLCPSTPANVKVDVTGCTETAPIALEGVNFKLNSAELNTDSNIILDRVVRTLSKHTELKVEVGGHTDSQGNDDYNLDLSARRAKTVVEYLINNGVSADNLTSSGYGESRPVTTNDTKEGRASNRRVELTRIANEEVASTQK